MLLVGLVIIILSISYRCENNNINAREVAITIDDLPTLSHGILSKKDQIEYFNRILSILDEYQITSMGFVVGSLIDEHEIGLLYDFCSKGHIIGNHTYSHFDLNKTDPFVYCNDIIKGWESVSGFQCADKYFRYPMLHRGDEKHKKDTVFNFLMKSDYIIVPVTIDSDETSYNISFVRAFTQGDMTKADSIGKEYMAHMIKQTNYYDSLATVNNNGQIPHILLLHMNFINSYYLDDLLDWYISQGWNFTTVTEAMEHPFYTKKDRYVGKRGISFVERIF